jgi:hypothetical protein
MTTWVNDSVLVVKLSNIFKTWLHALHEILFQQLMKELPSGEKNKLCMPMAFSTFTNSRRADDEFGEGILGNQKLKKLYYLNVSESGFESR